VRKGERVLWSGRPSFWNWWPDVFLSALLAFSASALAARESLGWALLCLACACAAASHACLRRLERGYVVTSERIILSRGYFSRRVFEIELSQVRAVVLVQSLWERVAGTGSLEIVCGAGEQVLLDGVRSPEAINEMIRGARFSVPGKAPHG
jgi:uncharacterized membrane protein YdbT with pleckstrin-like domain